MEKSFMRSNELLERAQKVTPLGAQTYSKSFRYFCQGISPTFIEKGDGCYLWDVDGNRYIDFICSLGPITVGYNNKRVNDAVTKQLNKGIIFSLQAEVELLLAEKIVEVIPCAEMVRFVKNGSDATSAAVRLSRAYTGRDMIAVSGYHGMHDWYIGSTVNNKGVPKAVCELTKSFKYNNLEDIETLLKQYEGKFAAVVLEPIQGNGPLDGYLQELKSLVHRHGALLVFDEVVSGFRYALGGASELYGVVPDLCAFGKGMGNGMPISAVAGRRSILKLIEQGVFISTTFGGEALSLAGALETIHILQEPGTYEKIWTLGRRMMSGLNELVKQYGLEEIVLLSGLPPHGGILFEGIGSLNYLDINTVYQQRMIERGILTVGINNINLSHSESDIDEFLSAADSALMDVRKAVDKDSIEGMVLGGMVDPIFKRNIK